MTPIALANGSSGATAPLNNSSVPTFPLSSQHTASNRTHLLAYIDALEQYTFQLAEQLVLRGDSLPIVPPLIRSEAMGGVLERLELMRRSMQ
jgi:hypothetical protein